MVRLGRDAVRPAPLPVRERGRVRGELPGGLHLRGAGPDARLVLLAAGGRDAARAGGPLPQRRVPGADPRRGGPEDVEVEGQHGRAVAGARHLRRGRVPLVLLHLQAALGRLPLLDGDDRRGRAPVPQAAVVDVLLLRALRARLRGRAGARPAAAQGPADDLDRWALSRTAGTAELVAERLDAYDATTAGRAIARLVDELSNWYVRRSRRRFWDGEPAAFATLRTCLLAVAKLLAPLCPFIADEIYDNLDGALRERAPVRLPVRRGGRSARRGARAGDGARARDGAPRAGRARQGEDQGAPAARRGGGGGRRDASARRSNAWPTSCARS